MRQIFLDYAKKGAMTKQELAKVLNITERSVDTLVRARKITPIPHLKPYRFDPIQMIETFCPVKAEEKPRSLTIERHKTNGTLKGGYLECL